MYHQKLLHVIEKAEDEVLRYIKLEKDDETGARSVKSIHEFTIRCLDEHIPFIKAAPEEIRITAPREMFEGFETFYDDVEEAQRQESMAELVSLIKQNDKQVEDLLDLRSDLVDQLTKLMR